MNQEHKEITPNDIRQAFSLSKDVLLIIDLRSEEIKAKYAHKQDPISFYMSNGIGISDQNIIIKY